VERISTLTRELIDAEEAYRNAKIAAFDGGCALSDGSVSSVFLFNDRSDGYSPSSENGLKARAPKGRIEHWRYSIATPPDDSEIGAASEDRFSGGGRKPIICWESASCNAEPRHHAKIQAWRKTCVAAGKKPEE
jgi:hypothetical protein